jgi:hypothetical protein
MEDDDSSNSYAEHGKQMFNSAKASLQKKFDDASSFVQNRSKTFWMVLGAGVVIMIALLVYEWWKASALWKRYINCPGCYVRFHNQIADCSDKRPIQRKRLTKPQNGYTYSMWLYVVDWYSGNSFGKWKSVYYRGAQLDRSNRSCGVTWDSIAKQQPGVWLSDTHNNIRVAVTTSVYLPAKCLSGSGSGEVKTSYGQCHATSMDVDMKDMSLLEFAEIRNFPIGEWFQLLFVVNKKRLELYLNGRLVKTTVFVGEYRNVCETENGHFASTGHTFRGRVLNFRYLPHALPYQMVQKLYQYESTNKLLKQRDPMDEMSE